MGQILHTCNLCSDYVSRCSSLDILDCSLDCTINCQNFIRVDHNSSEMNTNILLAKALMILKTSDVHYTFSNSYEKNFGRIVRNCPNGCVKKLGLFYKTSIVVQS